ncbi:patatin-like protein [Sphingoaurantiacus capsulatus]|uniref:Patatin-like protein n=1 Tax=Sphingoaurantiacus capsulatus TaxID=1771310 RepID=A0ABV7XAC4_9SPHN
MREKELRLALVCYGGVSLAVYMHGIVKEAWKLLRASRSVHERGEPADSLDDSAVVYRDLLQAMAPHVNLRLVVDIVAGASAGGINGIQLAHAVAGGHDMEPLRHLWLENADIEKLLDPDAAPASAWSKLYARPLVWFASRDRGDDVDRIADPVAREEVRLKLSRFIRSRWFEPPFSGAGFTRLLYEALEAMEQGKRTPALLPPGQPLDLFVTTTDFYGYPEHLPLNSPPSVMETEHRLLISFRDEGRTAPRAIGTRAALTFAARATASFPGAFPPFRAGELDEVLGEIGDVWPDRDAFLQRAFAKRVAAGLDPMDASLIDGSVLANAPFRPAIDALRARPAHREVDRRFVYIDPKPGGHLFRMKGGRSDEPPGFFTAILHSLSNIPREQPIRDNLESLGTLSRRVRRLRHIVAGMRDEVDAAIERELGRTLMFFGLTTARLTEWRSRVQTAAAREAGYAYAAYAHLKLSHVVEHIAEMLSPLGDHVARDARERVRSSLWRWVNRNAVNDVTAKPGLLGGTTACIAFLKRFDIQYRIRRLRFVIRTLNLTMADLPEGQSPAALDHMKTGLYELLAPYLDRRTPGFFGSDVREPARDLAEDPQPALDALGDALGLSALDAAADARMIELLMADDISKPVRRSLVLAYLGYPFFDIATLPLLQTDGLDEFDEIKVDRISPDDATAIREGGAAATLKGIQFNAFGAFFSRAWRENDYLWGRLHAAERLIDIVASSLPRGTALPAGLTDKLKRRAFHAILDAEREYLTHSGDLIDRLKKEVDDAA